MHELTRIIRIENIHCSHCKVTKTSSTVARLHSLDLREIPEHSGPDARLYPGELSL